MYFPNNQQVTIPFYRSEDEAMTVLNPEPMPYEVIGVQNHYGSSIHSGHYTAHVKDSCTQQWVHCNDIGGNSKTKPNFKIDAKHCYFVLLKKAHQAGN